MLFRPTNKGLLRLWALLLVLSLLFSQSVILHSHDHDSIGTNDHSINKIHSAYDLSHSEHHDGSVYEVSADGVLKNTSHTLPIFALFILPFALLLAAPLAQIAPRDREIKLIFYERYFFSPPLRAPPVR